MKKSELKIGNEYAIALYNERKDMYSGTLERGKLVKFDAARSVMQHGGYRATTKYNGIEFELLDRGLDEDGNPRKVSVRAQAVKGTWAEYLNVLQILELQDADRKAARDHNQTLMTGYVQRLQDAGVMVDMPSSPQAMLTLSLAQLQQVVDAIDSFAARAEA